MNNIIHRMARKKKVSKFKIALKNFILFFVLFLVSFVVYQFISNELYLNLFFILSVIFGFISLAFLIVLLVFFFLRKMKK